MLASRSGHCNFKTVFQLPDVEECFLSETIITVDFNTMSAILQKGNDELKLQRFANSADSWLWYFETDDETWKAYSEVSVYIKSFQFSMIKYFQNLTYFYILKQDIF